MSRTTSINTLFLRIKLRVLHVLYVLNEYE